jgi:hypothetical protein
MNFDPASNDFGNHKPSMLKPYTDKIDAMLRERRTFKVAVIPELG